MASLNPLPSHEGRPLPCLLAHRMVMFKSTPFSRRETRDAIVGLHIPVFKSTPFSRRETSMVVQATLILCLNPLPSHEGRPNHFIYIVWG